jgi:cyclic beta-1,2-glucan synthetase
MKNPAYNVYEMIMGSKSTFQGGSGSFKSEEPLRTELYSTDRLEEFGKVLAKFHKITAGKAPSQLLKRLDSNEAILIEVRKILAETVKENHRITPAGEWLLDNFYLIEEQIRTAKKHLPRRYSENLPQIKEGENAGQARVYDIAIQIISHSDGRIDLESLGSFIKSYQTVKNLQLGELWAIPIMLRLALIENLRRVAVRTAVDRIDRNLANYWAEQMQETAEKDPKSLIMVIADMASSSPPLVSAFVSELTRKLKGKGPSLVLPLNWIEQRLSESGLSSNDLINEENQKQAADQVSISNSISSLRLLSSLDWRDFVEAHSIVEQILREDLDNTYVQMDFTTRDQYRHVIEHLANHSDKEEHDIARIAIELAKESKAINEKDFRRSHVGYYLVGSGIAHTRKRIKMRIPVTERIYLFLGKQPLAMYLGSILLISGATTLYLLLHAVKETDNTYVLWFMAALSLISSSQFAIHLVNFISTLIAKPRLLPRMDYSKEISTEAKTLIVVPSLLGSIKDVESLTESLEVRFLANRDKNLHFGLLTDFTDSPEEHMPDDENLLQLIRERIEELNRKYKRENNDLFYLFHRPRKWNKQDRVWMGYERKRGKLADLNNLLRGKSMDHFSLIVGNLQVLHGVTYVITLDADTILPRGSAWKMIGTMDHPMNRAFYDERKKRVTHGYGILQPRVTTSLADADSTIYAKLNGNEPGIDPYTRATSDVYQDLFGEGSFIGKGIYKVDVFEKALASKFSENRILSHDLLEGCYVRSGLLSDVQLFEKHPTTYAADVKRRIRWIRGDWQIALWCTPLVKNENREWKKNPLSLLSRWKIFDNIRRSLVPIALTLLIIAGWMLMENPLYWTLVVSGLIILPVLVSASYDLINKPEELAITKHLKNSSRAFGNIIGRFLYTLICFPYEASYTLTAILQTVWRMAVTRRKLLEWNPFAYEEEKKAKSLPATYTKMWFVLFVSIAIIVYLIDSSPDKIVVVAPVLVLWIASPFITWFTSIPFKRQLVKLSKEQNEFLLQLSRKTWSFFEQFVVEEDNWLPPDNFQEYPVETIAHRTSPTNIGVSLLANLAAYDFGYLTSERLLERTLNTFNTLNKLERRNHHFYNWYNTRTLEPLHPRYISTVDSGNLAGHLLTLRQGILGLLHEGAICVKMAHGLRDTLNVFLKLIGEENARSLDSFRIYLTSFIQLPNPSLSTIRIFANELQELFLKQIQVIETASDTESDWWKVVLERHINELCDELEILMPLILLQEAPERFQEIPGRSDIPSLIELIKLNDEWNGILREYSTENISPVEVQWLQQFQKSVSVSCKMADERINLIDNLARRCADFSDMEWDFLYDKARHQLAIGYKVDDHQCDPGYYDLLASEARLCTFVTIAQGKLPEESWFALSRLLASADGDPVLLSWSGSMFEYLMPLLVMPNYENTILDNTYKTCVAKQIEYGKQRDVPWGISESGFNMVDAASNYQYAPFGTPGLGLKRGLSEDLVIAPYATALALMVKPEKACQNLEKMSEKGFEGRYGFYEAIDFTPSRLQRKQSHSIVQSFMAHHQGMSFLALAYLLLDKPMQKRFEAEPQFQATLLLLQERIPKATAFHSYTAEVSDLVNTPSGTEVRVIRTPDTHVPAVQLLSNGKYHLMVTNAGGSYSRWKDFALTRWREDTTCDNWGTFCYIRDLETGIFWSNTYQPVLKKGKNFEAALAEGRVDFRTTQNDIETHTEIVVSPEDDIEMRRIFISNRSGKKKVIDITSYAEVVLANPAADWMHQAFSKLFVQTEIIPHRRTILCSRRPRSSGEHPPWMFHLMMVHGVSVDEISYETDRLQFIGRGNTTRNPAAMQSNAPLSGHQGSVLDPIVAIRYKVILEADETANLDLIIGIGETRAICESLIDKYQDKHHKDRVFELAWTHSQVVLRQINAKDADAQLYGQLASSILFNNPALRADASIISKNYRGQSDLWSYSVSGDLPIVLLRIEDQNNIQLVRQMVQAHTYWKLKGLLVDLVIWNEDYGGYRQLLQNQIQSIIAAELTDSAGGIFVRSAEQISTEDRILFQTVARLIISDTQGSLSDHIILKPAARPVIPQLVPSRTAIPAPTSISSERELSYFNGLGGFSPDGREYVITIENKKMTPAPWANVIANKIFGTVISESGQSYTWFENAHEFRLTPWHNDPVSDAGGEVYYLRDEESGHFWSATPLPRGGMSAYKTRHGFGYSLFEHSENGIVSEMKVFVDPVSSVKFTVLKIINTSGASRRLSATGYIEWVLGDVRSKTAMYIITETDPDSGALFVRNSYNTEFARRVAFFDVDETHKTFTSDRTEFIGRNGSLHNPDAMSRQKLSGKLGSSIDPCTAIQVSFELKDGEEREIIFRLGCGNNSRDASSLVRQFRGKAKALEVFTNVKSFWKHTTEALLVETPDKAVNLLTNGWLAYQTIASRLWGRSGYYQSGGAYGYRDQLQDVLSLLHTSPQFAREQILLCASRQFKEGDVQHWWHPPTGRGVRTLCSDDYLWLPYVTCRYIMHTKDISLLNEMVPFIEGRLLNPGEYSHYDLAIQSAQSASVYEHCVRAINYGMKFGENGLPLMGAGDWNDGMDRVGVHGKGESVWLGFFYMISSYISVPLPECRMIFHSQKNAKLKLKNSK